MPNRLLPRRRRIDGLKWDGDFCAGAETRAAVDAALARFGRLDVLVNNAGGQFPSPAENLSPRGWEAVIKNNLNGLFFMTHAAATRAIARVGGRRKAAVATLAGFGSVKDGARRM